MCIAAVSHALLNWTVQLADDQSRVLGATVRGAAAFARYQGTFKPCFCLLWQATPRRLAGPQWCQCWRLLFCLFVLCVASPRW